MAHPHCIALTLGIDGDNDPVAVVRATDALRQCREDGCQALPGHQAVAWINRLTARQAGTIRDFVARTRLCGVAVTRLDHAALLALLRAKVRSGELCVLRKCTEGGYDDNDGSVKERRLVRTIEQQAGGSLTFAGREYRLVAGMAWARLAERDSYQVVPRREAAELLHGVAERTGGTVLRKLLDEATQMLSRDWRPPFHPDGLVLLRKTIVQEMAQTTAEPPLTPSQIKKLTQRDWIEVELVDQDGLPFRTRYQIKLPDNSASDGTFDEEGFVGVYEIASGDCQLKLLDRKEVGAAATEPPPPGEIESPPAIPCEVPPIVHRKIELRLWSTTDEKRTGISFELVLPSGEKHVGRSDDDGYYCLDGLGEEGNARLLVPDYDQAPVAEPTRAGRTRYRSGGVDIAIGASTDVELPPRARRLRLTGMHFETNKTFLLPSAMNGIRLLVRIYNSYPDLSLLIDGHADRQGDADYNRVLSQERAEAIRCYLVDDNAGWLHWYTWNMTSGQWGTREDQHMLSAVCDATGARFYTGPIDGNGDHSRAALNRFQDSRSMPHTWYGDRATREELIKAYMAIDGTSLPGAPVAIHGCGASHPVPETAGDPNPDQPLNRRVEIFLFEGPVEPPPSDPCVPAGCWEYDDWVAVTIETIDLDQPPGALSVVTTDETGTPLDGVHVHLSGVVVDDSVSIGGGQIFFNCLVPGPYALLADCGPDYEAADLVVDVPAGADPTGAAATATAVLVLRRIPPPEGHHADDMTCTVEFLGDF